MFAVGPGVNGVAGCQDLGCRICQALPTNLPSLPSAADSSTGGVEWFALSDSPMRCAALRLYLVEFPPLEVEQVPLGSPATKATSSPTFGRR